MYSEVVPDFLADFTSDSHGFQLFYDLSVVCLCYIVIKFCIELLIIRLSEALFHVVVLVLDNNSSPLVCWFNDNIIIISE